LGIGGNLISKKAVAEGNFEEVTEAATAVVGAVSGQ
jgi:2-keto-3-deoxy-6-phosphogluconate aldolase